MKHAPRMWIVLLLAGCGGTTTVVATQDTEVDLHVRVPCADPSCGGEAPAPAREVGRPPATMLALGSRHSCALTADGGIYCWGSNSRGQLGDVGEDTPFNPRRVPGLAVMDGVWAGAEQTCAREAENGTLFCWGDTGFGPNRESHFATPLPFRNVRQVALGYRIGCFIDEGGTTFCWGNYGAPHGPRWDSPQRVPIRGVSALSAGMQRHCGLDPRGNLICWGFPFAYWEIHRMTEPAWRLEGLAGVQTVVLPPHAPHGRPWIIDRNGRVHQTGLGESRRHGAHRAVGLTVVEGIENPADLVAGVSHACARLSNGTAACWGGNSDGQVGDGSEADRRQARFLTITSVQEIAAGHRHTCARADDAVYCWGRNNSGQVGVDGERTVLEPVAVPW